MREDFSELELERQSYQPKLPSILQKLSEVEFFGEGVLEAISGRRELCVRPLRVGVVFSGGPAPGGHNVISGLFDAIRAIHPDSKLKGFINGPDGILKDESIEITQELLAPYRNQGGFDLLGSGRTKVKTPEDFAAAATTCRMLDGLIIIGGDDSNTNAAHLARYFTKKGLRCSVIGVPKTIDGDLHSEWIPTSFGFDTATKVYAEAIGNICIDARSSHKYWHFIKLMGRSASHITLECALRTHPNITLIGEEIKAHRWTLEDVGNQVADAIERRGRDYGVVLIPEGLIEFICPESLPNEVKEKFHVDLDPHGNIQLAKIESERILIELVKSKLRSKGSKIKFSPQPHYLGYEGRCALPSNFDADYCYGLGQLSALLIDEGVTGVMSALSNLSGGPSDWKACAVPLETMMRNERIEKALVDLDGGPFKKLTAQREKWLMEDHYVAPGPMQFTSDSHPVTLDCLEGKT